MPENWYILLYRLLMESEIMTKPPEWFKLWVVILFKCNFEDRGIYKRGEFVTKYQTLADLAWVSYGVVDKFIRWWQSRDMVETEKLTRGVRLRVLNYDDYQLPVGTESGQSRDRVGTINKRIKKITKYNNTDTESPPSTPVVIEKKDYYETELARIEDVELREAVVTWWNYKDGYKSYKKAVGWKSFITRVLEFDKKISIAAIKTSMSNSWKGFFPEKEQTAKAQKPTQSDYYWLLEEWPEAIQVVARNELRDFAFINKKQVDENTARAKIFSAVVKYYKQPGKVTPEQATQLNELVAAWRERNKSTEIDVTPTSVEVAAIRKVIFNK